ncbi:hypothetical protein [Streptomyces chiangmaiensis]|uniref:Uncharacterized protein n=1 Tax=Streptomyces chiangmaiensis TaxID=766497 RepID=A0ABU7FNL1_9ACTN|nr:hypothetical protein [Streptomyces chiangmaiensis]MED7825398.1 hypothetical protein [Streptomyces chiangmaiensis]
MPDQAVSGGKDLPLAEATPVQVLRVTVPTARREGSRKQSSYAKA